MSEFDDLTKRAYAEALKQARDRLGDFRTERERQMFDEGWQRRGRFHQDAQAGRGIDPLHDDALVIIQRYELVTIPILQEVMRIGRSRAERLAQHLEHSKLIVPSATAGCWTVARAVTGAPPRSE